MTVSNEKNKIVYIGDGSTSDYPYDFIIPKAKYCIVYKTDTFGNQFELTQNSDYTVSGIGDSAGGTVSLSNNLEQDYKLTIYREMDFIHDADFTNQSAYFL